MVKYYVLIKDDKIFVTTSINVRDKGIKQGFIKFGYFEGYNVSHNFYLLKDYLNKESK